MAEKSLAEIVTEKPFEDFAEWWPMGDCFVGFMSNAIVTQWCNLHGNDGSLESVRQYATTYIQTVYGRTVRPSLVDEFVDQTWSQPIESGEFDALSYAFYHAAFDLIADQIDGYENPLARERRLFTKRVGKLFYAQVHDYLQPKLPMALADQQDFEELKSAINLIGGFLKREGYLRDHFGFPFTVNVQHGGRQIAQDEADFLRDLERDGVGYALYEMGYPVILPSAVYLYHTVGEAQHHSSRTIEELFDRVGYEARETDDFDPTGYPSEMVVELWKIRKLGNK